jgi:hypothetical protein
MRMSFRARGEGPSGTGGVARNLNACYLEGAPEPRRPRDIRRLVYDNHR